MMHDRMNTDELQLTQEFLAMMPGVRRPGDTVVAGTSRRAGLIQYKHGHVTIINRVGLEHPSREWSSVSRREFDRLLGIRSMSGSQPVLP